MIEEIVFIIISLGAAGATFILYSLVRASGLRDRRMIGFNALCVVVPFWILLDAFDGVVAPELTPALYVLKALPLNIVPYMSCWFILNFTESKFVKSKFLHVFLIAMPALALVMLATNPLHNMYILAFESPPVIGPLFVGHMLLSIPFIMVVYFVLFRYIIRHYKSNPFIIITGLGTIIPIILYLTYMFFPDTVARDYTPIGYFFTILFVAYAAYYSRLSKVKPGMLWRTLAGIARSAVIYNGTVEDAAGLISREACIALDTYRVGVWSYDEQANALENIISYSSTTGEFSVRDAIDLTNITKYEELLKTERIVIISNTDKPGEIADVLGSHNPDLCSLADAPVWSRGKLMGVVCVEQNICKAFPEKREWNLEEQSFITNLADIMAIAIINSERTALMQRLEEELSKNTEFIYAAISNSPVAMTMFGENFEIIDCNDAALELFGVTKDFYKNNFSKLSPEFQPGGEHSAELWMEYGKKIMSSDKFKFEWQHQSSSGELIPCEATVINIRQEDAPVKGLAYVYDMRDIKKVQRDLEKRDAMLSEALYREREAGRAKTDFLAKMSHEIRTPMNAIIGMSELALRERTLKGKDEHIATVKQAGSNLLDLINDLLEFSKIEAGKIDVAREAYSVASLITDTVNIIRMRAVSSKIHFAIKADTAIPESLCGDANKIRQALLNILGNAIKYTEEGFVLLCIDCEFVDDDTVNMVFRVVDSGIGIKSEDMDRLFTDFTQLNAEMNEAIEGVGLGLVITRNIVEAMGGSITVESDYGEGSTFTITIPQTISSRAPIASVERPETKSVLLYEDRAVYIDSITYALKKLGIKYCVVTDEAGLRREIERYNYLFISFDEYMRHEYLVNEIRGDTRTVILTDFGETMPESESTSLVMPIYCTQIAELLGEESSDAADEPGEESYNTKFTAPGARVLIVDDIRTNLIVAAGLLKPYKMHVDLCRGGVEAIEDIQAKRYDLVFMDHKMPGVDGVEATKRIRAMGENDPYYRNVPIIALTANAVEGMREMFIGNGFNEFLSKPIDMAELGTIVEKWLPDSLKKFL